MSLDIVSVLTLNFLYSHTAATLQAISPPTREAGMIKRA